MPARSGASPCAPVSVVIPFYRGAARLARALRSIERQTLQPLEVVLVDDGSPEPLRLEDDAGEITVPLRVVRHPRNRGIPAARNSGVRAAAGEWIAFLDQDDEWSPGKLERQWRCMRGVPDPRAAVVYGRCRVTREGAPGEGWLHPPAAAVARTERDAARSLMLAGNVVPFITLLLHRGVFERYGELDETLTGGSDDYELVLRLAAEGLAFRCADEPRGHSAAHYLTGSNYSDPERFFADEAVLLRALCGRYPALEPLRERSLARAHYRLARAYDGAGDRQHALSNHRMARALDPFWAAPWAALAMGRAPGALAAWLAGARSSFRRLRGRG